MYIWVPFKTILVLLISDLIVTIECTSYDLNPCSSASNMISIDQYSYTFRMLSDLML